MSLLTVSTRERRAAGCGSGNPLWQDEASMPSQKQQRPKSSHLLLWLSAVRAVSPLFLPQAMAALSAAMEG